MSIADCIADAVKAGTLSEKGAKEYADRMAEKEKLADEQGKTGPDKYIFATAEAAKEMERRATSKRSEVQATILAVDRAWEGASKNQHGIQWGLTDVMGEHVRGVGSGVSVGQQQRGNLSAMQGIMADLLSKLQTRMGGLKQNAALPRHLVTELYERSTGDADAKAGAKAWNAALEWWRDGMKAANVFVRELDDWRVPQHWDAGAVKSIGKDAFVDKLTEWWVGNHLLVRDWKADGDAHFAPGSQEATDRVREIFATAHDNITTGGDASIEPGAERHASMADRYGRRRVFQWATDDAWLEFNRTFGVGDSAVGELLDRHIENMSRSLALAQTFGPDPDRTARILIQMAQKEGMTPKWANHIEAMYDINSGKAMMPVDQRLALGFQAFRQFLTSVQLGGTLLSSLPDFGFTKATASWNGLSMSRIMAEYVKGLKPTSAADRAQAMRDGIILEVGLRGQHDAARDAINDIAGRPGAQNKIGAGLNGAARVTGRMAEFVVRAQGLSAHTQNLREAIGAEIQAHLADMAPRGWDKLTGIEKRMFTEYGMDAKDWETIRTKGIDQGFVSPAKLAREGEGAERETGVKLLGAMNTLARIAVPEGNSVTRAFMLGSSRPGTWPGEFARSFAQYKGFGMSAMMTTYFKTLETLADGEGKWNRAQWVASLIVSTTVLGALSNQLKAIAGGRDPDPMSSLSHPVFWARAFAQGGAGGIFGNELQAIFQSQRMGDASRAVTPMAGLALDLQQLALGPIHGEENPNRSGTTREMYGLEATHFLRKYTPSLWYTRLAMDRLVHDTLTKMADPDSAGTFARMEQRLQQGGTAYWWRPGAARPAQGELNISRAPNLGNALQ